jgi:hypothetical protein
VFYNLEGISEHDTKHKSPKYELIMTLNAWVKKRPQSQRQMKEWGMIHLTDKRLISLKCKVLPLNYKNQQFNRKLGKEHVYSMIFSNFKMISY